MKLERKNIQFPLWRKKVDKSILEGNETPIPKFLWALWDIENLFRNCRSKKNTDSFIRVYFSEKEFIGQIVIKKNRQYKLIIPSQLADELKKVYVMTFMREIESRLRSSKPKYKDTKIEEEIPFWEFLDIEFDSKNKAAYFNAHYVQKPMYFELFKEIINSHILTDIEYKLDGKIDFKIIKKDWRPKKELKNELGTKNVIYNLIDTINKEIYIGESESLIERFSGERNEIKNWNFYRFDSLPKGLTKKQRLEIERLIIRTFASFFKNDKGIMSMEVSDYKLKNKKNRPLSFWFKINHLRKIRSTPFKIIIKGANPVI